MTFEMFSSNSLKHPKRRTIFNFLDGNKRLSILIVVATVSLLFTYILYNSSVEYDFQKRIYFLWHSCTYPENNHSNCVSKSWINIEAVKQGVPQNDSRIVEYIKKKHLFRPPPLPYSLGDPTGDPGKGHWNGQNVIVKKILKNMKNGFFVEAGANDGEYISNTLALERDYNWTGLLVEPSPSEMPNLKSKHRKAWIADVCLSPIPYPATLEFLDRIGYTIASKLKEEERDKNLGSEWELHQVQCFPIFSLLVAMGVTTVDYFSLDVEGVELKVLRTIPFDSVFIKVFSVEYNLIPENKSELLSFMESNDYEVAEEVYHDYLFVHKSLRSVTMSLASS